MSKRYIDADAVMRLIPMEELVARMAIANAPTVDLVEVVRCKDCKYMPTGDGANHVLVFPEDFKCPCQCDDFWYSWKPDDNWFCGNGKRRE